MKIDLDKYYTNEGIVNHCIKVVDELGIDYTEVIEPSAGNGAFSLKIPNCIAYDIAPEHESVIEQDFLKLELPYKENRLIIGNPPFGSRNSLSVKFFKHSVDMCDYIAFILPVSQYNNNQQMYEFDLIYSEVLPLIEFSGRELLCCFNIYKRPKNGLNKTKINYKLNDVTILEWRRGGTYEIPLSYDLGICSWGASIGKEIKEQGQFALENYIIVNKPELKEKIIKLLLEVDWCDLYPNIATPRLGQWKIYKYLKEQIPALT
jgi:hypothetical protein